MSHVRAILVACGPLSLFRPSQAGINLKKASNLFLAGTRKKKYKRQQKKNQTFKFLHLYLSSKWALAIVTRPILKERTRIFPTRPLKEKNKGINFKCPCSIQCSEKKAHLYTNEHFGEEDTFKLALLRKNLLNTCCLPTPTVINYVLESGSNCPGMRSRLTSIEVNRR